MLVTQGGGLVGITLVAILFADGGLSGHGLTVTIIAGAVNTIGLGSFYRGLAVGKMSIVAPLTATSAVVPVMAGLLAGEQPSQGQAVGIALAACGVIAAATPADRREDSGSASARVGLILALIAALSFGLSQIGVARVAHSTDALWTVVGLRVGAVSAIVLGLAAFRPTVEVPPRRAAPLLAAIAVLDTAAPTFFAAATQNGLLSVVAVLAALNPAVTVILARGVLRERVTPLQGFGAAAILTGVAFIAGSA